MKKAPPHHPLAQLAQWHGIQTNYVDMAGQCQTASNEAMLGILQALGVPIQRPGQAPGFLRESQSRQAQQWLEPVHVQWQNRPSPVALRIPAQFLERAARWEWQLENGETFRQDFNLRDLPAERRRLQEKDSTAYRLFSPPDGLPTGYHRGILECGNHRFETLALVAPEKCFEAPPGARYWGIFAPLYALTSERGWGAGDFSSLRTALTWTHQRRGKLVGTLPLLPAFLGDPLEPSPYSPISRLFWNEFYLHLDSIPELKGCAEARKMLNDSSLLQQLEQWRVLPLVRYQEIMRLKRSVLEKLSSFFFRRSSERRNALEKTLKKNSQMLDYARFRAMQERHGAAWSQWSRPFRDGQLRDGDISKPAVQYHLYAQWLAHEQMTALSKHARRLGVSLYLDMPLGTHRDGYDAWRYQDIFALRVSGGAPPDPVFTQGQDWGFAPINPQRSRIQGHRYITDYLRHHLRHAGVLRFDHVMGLHRLYWVPQGRPASQGAYVTFPAEELYAILSIESHRHQAALLGENLGTVPPEVNEAMHRHGVGEMYVVQYECQPNPRRALRPLPLRCVASVNTHDMPPFAAWWNGRDIEDRSLLGLVKEEQIPHEYALRNKMKQALYKTLKQGGWLKGESMQAEPVLASLLALLASSRAQYLLVNLEDLWLETAPQNVPGTSTERINWRRKLAWPLEQIMRDSKVAELLALINGQRSSRKK